MYIIISLAPLSMEDGTDKKVRGERANNDGSAKQWVTLLVKRSLDSDRADTSPCCVLTSPFNRLPCYADQNVARRLVSWIELHRLSICPQLP